MLENNESQIIKANKMSLKFNQTEKSIKVIIFKVISYLCFHSISFLDKNIKLMYDIIFPIVYILSIIFKICLRCLMFPRIFLTKLGPK